MFALATLVLANAYRAKADTPPSASLSAGQVNALTAPVTLCPDQLLAKGRKTECGL